MGGVGGKGPEGKGWELGFGVMVGLGMGGNEVQVGASQIVGEGGFSNFLILLLSFQVWDGKSFSIHIEKDLPSNTSVFHFR